MTFFCLKVILVVFAGLTGALHSYQLESPRAAELCYRDENRGGSENAEDRDEF